MPNTAYLSSQRYLEMAKETIRGVPATPNIFLPVDPNMSLQSHIVWLYDTGGRGSPVKTYNAQAGAGWFGYSCSGSMFADSFPNLLMAALGGPDTAASVGGGLYTHQIGLINSASVGSQPPSYTIVDVDNVVEGANSAKRLIDGQLSSLDITFNADGAVTYKAEFLGYIPTEVVPTSATWSSENFVPAWNTAASIGGITASTITEGSISIKRDAVAIITNGSQSPYILFAGPADVTGSLKFVAYANEPNFANSVVTDHQVLSLTFTEPVSSHSINFTASQTQLIEPNVMSDKSYIEISTNFVSEANTTNATSGGFSPIVTTTTNGVSSAY